MVKLTFSLDEATVRQLRLAASRLGRPQSMVVREAINDYAARIGKLSEDERLRLLKVFDALVPAIPRRPLGGVERKLEEIRAARRRGGRRRASAR